ncbi:sulfatase-like hydrolase/transferase [Pedobacter sp. HMF7056]|uniref:Sulfatase-like hydrolase/transferase n=2 Tax=Hufsiella ginkgonis TaxID=2695274 RepID=A0A7K1XS52_9SPHI|nr:sulfatase-like hydrolase/transferase [Hufsiella ginkgonis]
MVKSLGFCKKALLLPALLLLVVPGYLAAQVPQLFYKPIPGTKPRNIIFILSDDHRYDFMGFTGKVPGLKTPNLDRLANEGAHLQNAFVTTALCSPSRASILTGQFAHTHTVVDNETAAPKGLVFFPQYMQKAGYQTGFFGKWHMGGGEGEPRPGFNRWVSFNGQGTYYNCRLNIDGKVVNYPDTAYITDILTDLSLDWLKQRDKNKPFFLYLSHKAVHADFKAAKRDAGRYKDVEIQYPVSMFTTATDKSKQYTRGKRADGSMYTFNTEDIPQWVRAQRYSWHGVDYMYHGQTDFDQFYIDYLETLQGIDTSVGRVLKYLEENGLNKETLVVYMGDNGFAFGEHGLIDKRQAYEESMRVPMLARCPGLIKPGTKVGQMILNVDIGPTFLELAGVNKPAQMQGVSFLPLLKGRQVPWRSQFCYEYYWESNFPQTPTQFAIRTDQYKFIRSQGIWDINQLYDIKKDPYEVNNLVRKPEYQQLIQKLNIELFKWLEETDGLQIPLKPVLERKKDHIYRGTW